VPGGRPRCCHAWPGSASPGVGVCDALVGAAAIEHDLTLISRDRRALATYREIGVRIEILA